MFEIAGLIGAENLEFLPPRLGEAQEPWANINKIKETLGWNPERLLEDYIQANLQ